MKNIDIITDSSCNLNSEQLNRYGIDGVVPWYADLIFPLTPFQAESASERGEPTTR